SLPWVSYETLLRTAANLCRAVEAVHAYQAIIGDLKDANLKVTEDARVMILDTDSFQIRGDAAGESYHATARSVEYCPPENASVNPATTELEPTHDYFCLAVQIFLLLMEGTPPFFSGKYVGPGEPPDVIERIQRGLSPYVPAEPLFERTPNMV